jgi:hypothetical protein
MTSTQPTLAEQAMATARRFAKLRHLPEDQVADAASYAWEYAQAGRGTPASIAWYAVKRVLSWRRFPQSERSLDGPPSRTGSKPERDVWFDVERYAEPNRDPAEIAGFWIDFTDWRGCLPGRMREIADVLVTGETTQAAAQRFGVSEGRISQIRQWLKDSYDAQFAE